MHFERSHTTKGRYHLLLIVMVFRHMPIIQFCWNCWKSNKNFFKILNFLHRRSRCSTWHVFCYNHFYHVTMWPGAAKHFITYQINVSNSEKPTFPLHSHWRPCHAAHFFAKLLLNHMSFSTLLTHFQLSFAMLFLVWPLGLLPCCVWNN